MTRLIDADKLCPDCMTKEGTLAISQSQIANAPTVEREPFATVAFDKDELDRIVDERVIEPIKNGELVIKEKRPTGHWIKETTDDLPVPFELLVCSNCKKEAIIDDWNCYVKSDFCPNCGAEMGKEAEE